MKQLEKILEEKTPSVNVIVSQKAYLKIKDLDTFQSSGPLSSL